MDTIKATLQAGEVVAAHRSIPHQTLLDALHSLGVDTSNSYETVITPSEITVKSYAHNPLGKKYFVGGALATNTTVTTITET